MVLLLNAHHHPLLDRIAANVRSLRKLRGWSRRDLAQRAGISERFLADVEAAHANPSVLRLAALADVLEIDLSSLFTATAATPRRHLALLGLRGAGKSTVGPLVARELGCDFVELDELVERSSGLSLDEIFQMHGEAYYRAAERTELLRLLAGEPCVLAVGGGIVTDPNSFAALRAGARTIWLRARPEDHWQRVVAQGDLRPMANNEQAFGDLRRILAAREPLYRQADLVVETADRSVDEVVAAVLAALPVPEPR